MPRIPPRLLHQASSINPLLRKLLSAARDLQSAKNELRWLKEHAMEQSLRRNGEAPNEAERHGDASRRLQRYCEERGRGKPLQYILGTAFFGDLEIKCEEGVLIPRWETASLVEHFATVIHTRCSSSSRPLRILEPCTGTGCMSLLLQHTLTRLKYPEPVKTLGLDISSQAIKLARHNLSRLPHVTDGHKDSTVDFRLADVFRQDSLPSQETRSVPSRQSVLEQYDLAHRVHATKNAFMSNNLSGPAMVNRQTVGGWDLLLSNPPYVSPRQYARTTSLSVRKHEPRIALVPPSTHAESKLDMTDEERGDLFYPALLDLAKKIGVRGVMFEIGDAKQAGRVVGMVMEKLGEGWEVEVWRDEPAAKEEDDLTEGEEGLEGRVVRGRGRVRGVFAWREGARVDGLGGGADGDAN
ncbi:hypothetical protein KVT40_006135 [Elsinoe batatas]|uniref:S-adenosyl-L-methionine-dependent methyltransferase n=1 Tax=Elsinoe batatas TaxID=2601811 RepID=A0A8K0KZN5_9PEZI|nr:hypothetical protein KVT40_006135 [Elsinoe batatas]